MVEIILASHSQLAQGLVATGGMICGDDLKKGVYILSLKEDDLGIDNFRAQVESLASKLSSSKVLILTDLFGATPFNVCCKAFYDIDHQILTGMNLPMLLEAWLSKDMIDLEAYAEKVMLAGHEGLQNYRFEKKLQQVEEDIFG